MCSLINYETVKCFSNEPYELGRFNEAVRAYQHYSITVQASLSLLNVIQQVQDDLPLTPHLSTSRSASSPETTAGPYHPPPQTGQLIPFVSLLCCLR